MKLALKGRNISINNKKIGDFLASLELVILPIV